MTETFLEITEDQFHEQYQLRPNHINAGAGWTIGEGGGCLFETYSPEFDFVRRYDLTKVWTLVDGDDGDMYLVSGLHYVNRVGYLISHESVPDDTCVQVQLPMHRDNDEVCP